MASLSASRQINLDVKVAPLWNAFYSRNVTHTPTESRSAAILLPAASDERHRSAAKYRIFLPAAWGAKYESTTLLAVVCLCRRKTRKVPYNWIPRQTPVAFRLSPANGGNDEIERKLCAYLDDVLSTGRLPLV